MTITNNDCTWIGLPVDRVDGRLKVTGAAHYAAENQIKNAAYGAVVQSTIAKGRIKSIDSGDASKVAGVLAVFSCANKPMTLKGDKGDHLFLLQDDKVKFAGQMIALVVAETLEAAKYAASLVHVTYESAKAKTKFEENLKSVLSSPLESPTRRGDYARGLSQGPVKVEATYTTPTEAHNPMEPFATIAAWEGDSLNLYDTTQAVFGTKRTVAEILGISPDKVHVHSHFVGGGFGCKLSVWPQVVLSAMAAKNLQRPVKVVLGRNQMFGPVGFRPQTRQSLKLAASKDGKLTALSHTGISETCTYKEFSESVDWASKQLYACPNAEFGMRTVRLDIGEPTWMRAPGHATGSFALESAMDELAYALNIDPIELRLRNFADKDPQSGLPWSSNALRQCYSEGAKRFGWQKRNPKPRSMHEGNLLVGMGMATAMHSCWRNPASARVRLNKDGHALVQSGSQDIGTGTRTIMAQIAAETLSLPMTQVTVELGMTHLPEAPLSGGSTTAAAVGTAVAEASDAALKKLIAAAVADQSSPLHGVKKSDVVARAGKLFVKGSADKGESYSDVLARVAGHAVEATVSTKLGEEKHSYSTFGAQFVEVKVDQDLGTVAVSRVVGVYGAGRILNQKTARNQMLGGITFGLGMALMEEVVMDHNLGRIVNNDFAEYHVPVNADIGDLQVHFVDEHDPHVNDLGIKGIGELGISGVAAAIANAVYHATGRRIRDLPITLDKLL